MRFAHVFTVMLSFAGFILMVLSLFAGSSKSFLQQAPIMTVNTTGFGQGSVFTATTLGLSDFYEVYVLGVCQGQFEPNAMATDPKENVTSCSSTQAGFNFDLSEVIADVLPPGASLANVSWPTGIVDSESPNRAMSIAMFFFFVVGIATAVFSAIARMWGIWSKRTLSSVMAFTTTFIGFLNSGLAASCATALSVNSVNNINTNGNNLGISASVGVRVLGIAWAATASMLGAAAFAGAQGCAGRNYNGDYKVSTRHMRVPRSWRDPGMRYHILHHPAMHSMGPPHPAMHPAMHTDMYAGMEHSPRCIHPWQIHL